MIKYNHHILPRKIKRLFEHTHIKHIYVIFGFRLYKNNLTSKN